MLAIDRRIFDIPLEERFQGRTSDLAAWTKTMQLTIRAYFSDTVAPERNMNETLATTITTTANTTTDRIGPRLTEFRQRPQQPRTQPLL
jgi:hypothetical protein